LNEFNEKKNEKNTEKIANKSVVNLAGQDARPAPVGTLRLNNKLN
jgi:hypothetical protein